MRLPEMQVRRLAQILHRMYKGLLHRLEMRPDLSSLTSDNMEAAAATHHLEKTEEHNKQPGGSWISRTEPGD